MRPEVGVDDAQVRVLRIPKSWEDGRHYKRIKTLTSPIFHYLCRMVPRALYTSFLALLLLLQATAWWAFLQIKETSRERYVAAQLEAGVDEGQVQVLRIPRSWEDGRHPHFQHVGRGEVRYYSRMYDVIRIEERGDTMLYHGIYDREETELFDAARDLDLGRGGECARLPLLLSCCPAVLNCRCLPRVRLPQQMTPALFSSPALPANQWAQGPPTPPPKCRS